MLNPQYEIGEVQLKPLDIATEALLRPGYAVAPVELGGADSTLVAKLLPFFKGDPGTPGIGGAGISADPDNAIINSPNDGGVYAPTAFTVAARFAELPDETAKAQARQNLGLETIDGGTFT